ncbi:MAG: SDR family oxidoreductase [Planctomycetota bacterium]|nr:MAG: SDR family oxidoreductase [Planctomycetota bacterium]
MLNRVVLITGASSGIGAAAARRLARSSRLVLVARREDRLAQLAKDIRDEGGEVHTIATDLLTPGCENAIVDETVQAFGGLDVLINNAGVFLTGPLAESDAGTIDAVFNLNVRAPMLLTRAAVPQLKANGGGWIINISSIAAVQVFPGCGVYAAAKAALDQWSRVIREELRVDGVRVSVVSPGATATEAWGDALPSERMSRAEDIAAAIHYCLDQPPTVSVDQIVVTPPAGPL